jgi:eukaryotic-like serine/threonine-protein kinase
VTLLRRLLGVDDDDDDDEIDRRPKPISEPPAPTAADELAKLGDPGSSAPSAERVLDLFEAVRAEGREARALDLVRRVIALHPALDPLSLRVAEVLSSRGDDADADALLRPIVDRPGAPLHAAMLAGEIAERRGDRTRARALYERVLAREVDYPRARERVQRLLEERESRRDLGGATLMTDGALARGRYRVLYELGRGGAGTVFAAQDIELGRLVALKIYHRRGRAERERLLVEARTPARLEHPGIVRIFDVDEELVALAMEGLDRGTVRKEIDKAQVTFRRVERWLLTTVDAVAFIHAAGFVHRDLKPSNFLLRADDRVVLTDFGLAGRVGEATALREGAGEGTLAYMPPEQRAGASAAATQDVHALGASMREILRRVTGPVPEHLFEVANACTRTDPQSRPSLSDIEKEITR